MGYFEFYCQLCGVSFSICRIRRADEPEEAAWSSSGDFVEGDEAWGPCDDSTGCTNVLRSSTDREKEHLAGTGCCATGGYSGYRITVEEMKGCTEVQCLVFKTPNWCPEDDDQDFELTSKYFLSGVGDAPETETSPCRNMRPIRHGADDLLLSNLGEFLSETDEAEDNGQCGQWGLPFHKSCFDIYKRISTRCVGHVDVDALYDFFIDCRDFLYTYKWDPATELCQQQWWSHEPGSEYLAANPCTVPIVQLLSTVTVEGDARLHPAFYISAKRSSQATSPPKSSSDLLGLLPQELLHSILDLLTSKDIANLRCASRTVRVLPQLLFRRLFLQDMPWIWEAEKLDIARTDWHRLYTTAKFCWMDLKGLKNRRRIWKHVEDIVRRVQEAKKDQQ